jgi:2-hydroxy-6-oxonona-2,4-dienedioate hydrolase
MTKSPAGRGEPRKRRRSRIAWGFALAAMLIGGAAVAKAYRADRLSALERITGKSLLIQTRHGSVEYAEAGSGPPLLMIHGTGGGFDQGLAFSQATIKQGIRVIAPSRFGYLRSSWPTQPSSENQADAFVDLLDHLKLDKVVVAGGSAGALSAVQFALRHPERTSGLILIVPAANVEGHDPNEMNPTQEWLVRRLMTSDFLFWAAKEVMGKQMIGLLLATDADLLARATPAERRRAYEILDQILPISRRWRGMLNDAKLAGHPARVDFRQLRVPLLLLSADDDRFNTGPTARAIARQVPGSQLIIYPTGGHIFLGRQEDSAMNTARFIRAHQR